MTQSGISLSKLALYYLAIHLGMAVLLIAVLWVFEAFFNYSGESPNVMGILLPLLASMQVGTIWYNRTGARPAGSAAWKASALFTLITFAINFGFAAILYYNALLPELQGMTNDPNAPMILTGIVVFVMVLILLMCRGGLSIGARQAEKLKAKQDAKRVR